MASTSSGLSKKIVLNLLDDQPGLKADSLDWSVKAQLPPVMRPVSAPPPAAVSPLLGKSPPKARGQIFRDNTTFKQLLDEYNKSHRAPLNRTSSVQDYLPSRRQGFAPEPVEHIALPTIPGKILRPE